MYTEQNTSKEIEWKIRNCEKQLQDLSEKEFKASQNDPPTPELKHKIHLEAVKARERKKLLQEILRKKQVLKLFSKR